MDEVDREVIGLRYLDELSFDEIAAVLVITLSAAKMRHLRALERLRGLLEELGDFQIGREIGRDGIRVVCEAQINGLAFSPDRLLLGSVAQDGTVCLRYAIP
jgi:hypothetical protein